MISVQEALDKIFELLTPLNTEVIPLDQALGRVLAEPVIARRDQPPFAASVMDGYAVPAESLSPGEIYTVIGEAAAGHRFKGKISGTDCVRIFTGAPIPEGAQRVVIQEDVERDGDTITIRSEADSKLYIRALGADFRADDTIESKKRLSPEDIALIAAMNCPDVTVYRRPNVALIATGDELVPPGGEPGDDQIIASNALGLAALVQSSGGIARRLPIARDTEESLRAVFELAKDVDLIVTIGGASVGDHDLVGKVAADLGMVRAFYKIAMRPGKPLMAGTLNGAPMIGLPGNPVSSMVCGHVFLKPALNVLQGLPPEPLTTRQLPLGEALQANGPRAHYMRAVADGDTVTAESRQDSALLSVLARANALVVRPPNAPAAVAGETVDVIDL